jgi:glucose-1-phosphate adenylyltransferase
MVANSYSRSAGFQAVQRTTAMVLAGGKGSRLKELTSKAAKPAVHFAGKYRIIDFTLSNCVNSGIRRIGVLTQFMANDLIRHLQSAWGRINPELSEGVYIMPAQQRTGERWYRGTADAVYQCLDLVDRERTDRLLVLGGDHIYKMDYSRMVNFHIEKKADLTVACVEKPLESASMFGVVTLNNEGQVTDFNEKPQCPIPMPGNPHRAMCSMGIYIFSMDVLERELKAAMKRPDYTHDFGRDIIPQMIEHANIYGYLFTARGHPCKNAYWRDVGSLDEYHEANMDLLQPLPKLDIYDQNWPLQTHQQQRPGAKMVFNEEGRRGSAIDSVLSAGVIISGAEVNRSLLGTDVRIEEHSVVNDSVFLPGASVGKGCRINKAIIGEKCHIPDGTLIGQYLEADRERFTVSNGGVVLVTSSMLGDVN